MQSFPTLGVSDVSGRHCSMRSASPLYVKHDDALSGARTCEKCVLLRPAKVPTSIAERRGLALLTRALLSPGTAHEAPGAERGLRVLQPAVGGDSPSLLGGNGGDGGAKAARGDGVIAWNAVASASLAVFGL